MKSITSFLTIVFLSVLSVYSNAQVSQRGKSELGKDKNILIVYLSRTKNTKAGYGVGSSFRDIKELCPNSTVVIDSYPKLFNRIWT